MKSHSISVFLLLIIFLSAVGCGEEPEEPDPDRRKSPIAIANLTHGDTYLKVVYGQPYKRGRVIFGELEAYGEVWRTGANEATELTTTRDINFAGTRVEAGTYALFTIPRPEEWTVILNSQLGQWGAFEYNSDYDVLRVDVPAIHTEDVAEAFTIQLGEVVEDSTSMIMKWDQTEIRVPIRFLNQEDAS